MCCCSMHTCLSPSYGTAACTFATNLHAEVVVAAGGPSLAATGLHGLALAVQLQATASHCLQCRPGKRNLAPASRASV